MPLIIEEILNHHLKNKKDKIILYNILLKKRYIKKIKTNYFIKMKEERKFLLPKLKKHYNYQVNNIILKEVLYSFYEGKLLNQIFLKLLFNKLIIIRNLKYIKKKYIKEKKLLLYKAYKIFEVFDFMLEIIKKKERLKIYIKI